MHKDIAELLEVEPSETPVLSLYLDTTRPAGKPTWEPWLKQRLAELGRTLSPLERAAFQRSGARATAVLRDLAPDVRGVALFACEEPDMLRCLPSERPYSNHASAGRAPVLYPLVTRLEDTHSLGILLVDSERARLYTLRMGHLEPAVALSAPREHPERPGHGAQGAPRQGAGYGASTLHYQRYLEQQKERHLAEVVAALEKLIEREKLDYFVLSGNDQITQALRKHLPPAVEDRLLGTGRIPIGAGHDEILRHSLAALAESLQSARQARASSLVDEFRVGGLAVLGVSNCLRALSRGQVDELLLSPDFAASGRTCLACHEAVLGSETACPVCQGQLGPSVDLRETIVRRAEQTDARLEVVNAPELVEWGGVGAWLRYPEERSER